MRKIGFQNSVNLKDGNQAADFASRYTYRMSVKTHIVSLIGIVIMVAIVMVFVVK